MKQFSKPIALTFDDGPTPTSLPIIEALAANHCAATFFVNGVQLKKYPEITARAAGIGCEIGNHTSDHRHLPELDYDEIIRQIEPTTAQIYAITGVRPTVMRPPFGETNETVRRAARDCRFALINWSIDPKDWDHNDPGIIRECIINQVKDGALILCHDRMSGTAELMPHLISELKERGYQLVTVSQLFRAKHIKLIHGTLYYSPNDQPESLS